MAVDGCGIVCKYILFIFNVVFAVVGFASLILGMWLRFSSTTSIIFEVQNFNSSAFVMGVMVLIVLGSVMLIVVAFGDYGACSEKRWSLQVFSVLVACLAIAEVVVGVLTYLRSGEVGMRIGEFYITIYTLYLSSGDPAIAVTLTFIHKMLHCCGVSGVTMLDFAKTTCPAPDGFFEHIIMPNCPLIIIDVFNSKAPLVMGLFIGTGALLIIALICSTILSKQLRLSASSPQYIILTQSTAIPPNPAPPQQEFPHLDQDPVVFTPLTVANIPVAQT